MELNDLERRLWAGADEFYVYGPGEFHLADADPAAGDRIFALKGAALPAGADPYARGAYQEIAGAFVKQEGGGKLWKSLDGRITITQNSPTTITTADGLTLIVDNFADGDYGINLEDYTGSIAPAMTVAGDLAPVDQDPATPGLQLGYDANGNLIVGGAAEPGRADRLYGSGLSDQVTAGRCDRLPRISTSYWFSIFDKPLASVGECHGRPSPELNLCVTTLPTRKYMNRDKLCVLAALIALSSVTGAEEPLPSQLSGRWVAPYGRSSNAVSLTVDTGGKTGKLTVWSRYTECTMQSIPANISKQANGEILVEVSKDFSNRCMSNVSMVIRKIEASNQYAGTLNLGTRDFNATDVSLTADPTGQ